MFIIYDLIILVIVLIYLPVYLFRKKFHPGFKTRLGILPAGLQLNRPIWIHAVSVGEAMAARGLIRELRGAYPDKRFFITTVTATGNKIARAIAGTGDFVAYFPLDFSFIVRRVVERIKPCLFIIMETEIWPNLISCLYQRNVPIVLVNARISDRSFKGYLALKFLLRPLLNRVNLFCAQGEGDAQRLARLGVSDNRIEITGNMKFDIQEDSAAQKNYTEDKLKLGLGTLEKLWVAGSTHPGEEEVILGAYKKLRDEFPSLRLLLAPRHPERARAIEELASGLGLSATLVSQVASKIYSKRPLFILDTIGELTRFYHLADIVFVGGSLVRKGGHNILEPAILAKPVLFGPYMFNFRDIADLFLKGKAAILVRDKEGLEIEMRALLNNPERLSELGRAARSLLLANQGATPKNAGYIRNYIFIPKRGRI